MNDDRKKPAPRGKGGGKPRFDGPGKPREARGEAKKPFQRQDGMKRAFAKSEDGRVIVHAVREVLAGRMYVNPAQAGRMLSGLLSGTGGSPVQKLTDREFEVFELLGQGLGTQQIADRLHISTGTVDAHREHIKKKLDVPSAQKLTVFAVQWFQASRGAI